MDGIPVDFPPELRHQMEVRNFSDNPYDIQVGFCELYRLPEYTPAPSDWASEDAAEAVELGLVDEDIQWWWKDACTREEFCRMVVRGLEAVTGRSGAELAAGQAAETFSDCDSEAVAVASALGIVNGVGHGQFAPERFLTRQQAATMLARAAAYLGYEPNGESVEFADADTFADWAAESIAAVSALRRGAEEVPLMQGKTGGVFDPNGYYTVEQAAVTVLRMVQFC